MATLWWSALDAAETAVYAANGSLEPEERRALNAALTAERAWTLALLEQVARAERVPVRFSRVPARRLLARA